MSEEPVSRPEFDPERVLKVLVDEGVDFIVIGGLAARLHGSSLLTADVDVLPSRQEENLQRLGSALRQLNARIRTAGDPVETRIDGAFLASMPTMLNLVTDAGDVDIAFTPAGPLSGYEEWRIHAVEMDVADGMVIHVAALDDIIASKKAADRPKDRMSVPYLESLREQIREG